MESRLANVGIYGVCEKRYINVVSCLIRLVIILTTYHCLHMMYRAIIRIKKHCLFLNKEHSRNYCDVSCLIHSYWSPSSNGTQYGQPKHARLTITTQKLAISSFAGHVTLSK